MKILVDFVRAEQHWDPDTEEQQNFLVFGFGGAEHRIPCEEGDIVKAIRESKGSRASAGVPLPTSSVVPPLDPSFQRIESDEEGYVGPSDDDLMGGDEDKPVQNPPLTFEATVQDEPPEPREKTSTQQRQELIREGLASRPRSTEKIRQAKMDRLREVARKAPQRTVAADEMGNPDVPNDQQLQGPMPTVTRVKRQETRDDDPFSQG